MARIFDWPVDVPVHEAVMQALGAASGTRHLRVHPGRSPQEVGGPSPRRLERREVRGDEDGR